MVSALDVGEDEAAVDRRLRCRETANVVQRVSAVGDGAGVHVAVRAGVPGGCAVCGDLDLASRGPGRSEPGQPDDVLPRGGVDDLVRATLRVVLVAQARGERRIQCRPWLVVPEVG